LGVAKLAADPAKNLGDGGRCDGGQGSAKGKGKSGSGGGSKGPSCSQIKGSPSVGDPINTSTGNFFLQEDDYVENGWLTFRRFYNSDPTVAPSQSGSQWRHSFNRSLMIMGSPASIITLFRPDGTRETFTKSGGVWSTELLVDHLTENDDAQGNAQSYAVFMGANQQTETYDTFGKLISVVDENGQGITLTYSTSATPTSVAPVSGLLIAVTDPNGRQLKFVYYSNIKLESVTLPDGGQLGYSYSLSTGDTTEVFYPDGKNRQYFYNESSLTGGANLPNSMTGIQDEAGIRYESISYDSQGRATSSVFKGSVSATHIVYNADGSSSVTYPLGHTANLGVTMINGLVRSGTVDQPCNPDCEQPWKSRTYDANGYPASYTDFKNTTSATTYDSYGLLEQEVEGVGTSNQRTTVTSWDFNLRKRLSERVLDAQGNTVSLRGWSYDTAGNVAASCEMDTTVSNALSYTCSASGAAPAGVRRATYTYCTTVDTTQCPVVGLLLTSSGPRSDVNQTYAYAYYLVDSSTSRHGDLKSVTDPLGHTVTYASYDAGGRITRVIDQNGVVKDLTYTQRGWLQTATVRANANGSTSSSDAKTTIAYTNYGAVSSVTDADGVVIKYTYDDTHRLIKVTDGAGNFILYTLDAAGNRTLAQTATSGGTLTRSSKGTFNSIGQLVGAIDGLNHSTFDASAVGSYDNNGNLVNSSDGLGIKRNRSYDALNRTIELLDNFNGTDPTTSNATATYGYDAMGRLEGITDPDNLSTTYDYDGLGNPKATHSPDTGTSSRVYDIAGNVVQATDAKGVVVNRTYDALDRVQAVTYSDSSLNASYHYDESNSITGCAGSFPVGHLTRLVEGAVTTVYCYDNQGNVTAKSQTQGAQTDIIRYAYTLANRLKSVTSPNLNVTQYSRDAVGRVTSVSISIAGGANQTVVSSITYLPFGPVASYTLGSGQSVARTFNANYALTDVTSSPLTLHFARDVLGNITALGNTSGANPAIESYSYDALHRLTGISGASGQSVEGYSYSKTGDRLAKTSLVGSSTGAYGYQSGTHWLASVGSSARSYDTNGNTTGIAVGAGTLGFGYDGRNRLVVVQNNQQTVASYTYNAVGQRVGKVVTSPQALNERFTYNEKGQLLSEVGTNVRDYVWVGDLPVATVDMASGTSSVNYVIADGLSTPRVVTNATGSVIWQWPYQSNAFGEASPTGSYVYNLRFSGQYFDSESGLVYNGQRYFDPTTGRYVQSDALGLNAGLTTYGYVGGNPLADSDPFGLAGGKTSVWLGSKSLGYKAHEFLAFQNQDGTGPVWVLRAGPSNGEPWLTNIVLNRVEIDPGTNAPKYIQAAVQYGPSSEDLKDPSYSREDASVTVVDENVTEVLKWAWSVQWGFNPLQIPYRAQTMNSNTFASNAYKWLTGKDAPGQGSDYPGSLSTLPVDFTIHCHQ